MSYSELPTYYKECIHTFRPVRVQNFHYQQILHLLLVHLQISSLPCRVSSVDQMDEVGYTLDQSITGLKQRRRTIHTFILPRHNLELPGDLTCMSLGCWRKPGAPRGNPHRHRKKMHHLSPEPSCCEVRVLTNALQYYPITTFLLFALNIVTHECLL